MRHAYCDKFLADLAETTLGSARAIAPIVMELVRPTSVIDVGCGLGAWLLAFQECGVSRLRGIDGHYVDRTHLRVDPSCFVAADLASGSFSIEGRYDLALCLEVAEHLPERNADRLVQVLTEAAPVILFSAAVPGQGGVNHLNEQWPDYWSELFRYRGFRMIDALRPKIRDNSRVAWFYRQNLLVYVSELAVNNSAWIGDIRGCPSPGIEWVHMAVVRNYRDPKSWWRLNTQGIRRVLQRKLRRKGA